MVSGTSTVALFIFCVSFASFVKSSSAQVDLECSSNCSTNSCSCEESCLRYGDCCFDVEINETEIEVQELISRRSCLKVQTLNKTIKIFVIDTCLQTWSLTELSSKHVKEKCEKTLTSSDPFLSVPISSRRSGEIYKNLYCAVCNHDRDSIEPWAVYSRCTNSSEDGECLLHQLSFEPTPNIAPRGCNDYGISKCPEEWEDADNSTNTRAECERYNSPQRMKFDPWLIVKNVYCAQCNNISLEEIRCVKRSSSPPPSQTPTPLKYSFSIIMDIDFNSGGSVVGSKQRCAPNYVYDPWKNSCRLISCDSNSEYIDNKCVPSYRVGPTNDTTPQETCPRMGLDPEEYIIVENSAVFIYANNKSYHLGEYSINRTTGILSICIYPEAGSKERTFSDFQGYLSTAGISVSIISLIIKILVFFFKPEPRRTSNILVLFLSVCVLVAQVLFLFGVNRNESFFVCKLIAIVMHYSFLASFFWMNVLAYDMYRTFSSQLHPNSKSTSKVLLYSAYGWTLPALIIGASVGANENNLFLGTLSLYISPNYGDRGFCWITNKVGLLVFFAIPLALLLLVNTGLFVTTAFKIKSASRATKIARENIDRKQDKWRFILYIKLALLMGLTWIFGFIAAYADSPFLWALFIVFNSLQGFFIFTAFTHINCFVPASLRIRSKRSIEMTAKETKSFIFSTINPFCGQIVDILNYRPKPI